MVFFVSQLTMNTEKTNEIVGKEIYKLCMKDQYFSEKPLPAVIMTHGFMAEVRRGWDLLGSVDDVKVKAAEQMKALTFAMELADAALSAACTCKSTAVAAKAAKVAEAAMAEREEKRMEKLRQRAADKQAKAEAKARAKEDKKAAREAAKKAQEEQGEVAEGDGVAEGQEEPA